MSKNEYVRAPGIGVPGEVTISNYGTRAVKVVSDLLTPADLHREIGDPVFRAPGITRSVVKGISATPFGIGELIMNHTVPFTVEAQIPFENSCGEKFYWSVIGRNSPERLPPDSLVTVQKKMIRDIASDPKYAPQSVDEMREFIMKNNPGLKYYLERITPANFGTLSQGLVALYREAFKDYPYDVVTAIGSSCADNLFVVARGEDGRVYSVTGAEYIYGAGGTVIGEIGDTASLPSVRGFGPFLKRVLFQQMVEHNAVPDLVFTDSRLDINGFVIKANRRAGLELNPDILLPAHTTIASVRTEGSEMTQRTPDGGEFPVENMTMTHLTRKGVYAVISDYGKAY